LLFRIQIDIMTFFFKWCCDQPKASHLLGKDSSSNLHSQAQDNFKVWLKYCMEPDTSGSCL
jgi:hypothetical protein